MPHPSPDAIVAARLLVRERDLRRDLARQVYAELSPEHVASALSAAAHHLDAAAAALFAGGADALEEAREQVLFAACRDWSVVVQSRVCSRLGLRRSDVMAFVAGMPGTPPAVMYHALSRREARTDRLALAQLTGDVFRALRAGVSRADFPRIRRWGLRQDFLQRRGIVSHDDLTHAEFALLRWLYICAPRDVPREMCERWLRSTALGRPRGPAAGARSAPRGRRPRARRRRQAGTRSSSRSGDSGGEPPGDLAARRPA